MKKLIKNNNGQPLNGTSGAYVDLTSKCPIDDDGTPLYNRSGEGKEGYSIINNVSACFFGCTNMSDYDSIPSEWKSM